MSPDWSSSPEAVPYASLANPQSMNLYAYVGNDPIDGVDPDGHFVYTNQDGFTNSFADLGAWDELAVMNKDAIQPASSNMLSNGSGECFINILCWIKGVIGGGDDGEAGSSQTFTRWQLQSFLNTLNKGAGRLTNRGEFNLRDQSDREALGDVMNTALGVIIPAIFSDGMSLEEEAAESAADASRAVKFGAGKSATKWANQLLKRGWTQSEIGDAIANGESVPAVNNINPANGATRYVSPSSGKSVVVDNVTREVIHVCGAGFKY